MEADVDWDTHSVSKENSVSKLEDSQVTENQGATQAEGETHTTIPSSAGTSLRGRTRTMS